MTDQNPTREELLARLKDAEKRLAGLAEPTGPGPITMSELRERYLALFDRADLDRQPAAKDDTGGGQVRHCREHLPLYRLHQDRPGNFSHSRRRGKLR